MDHITRRRLLAQGALAAAALAAPGLLAQEVGRDRPRPELVPGRKPNVLLIYTDDQNFDTMACYGSQVLTPNIDRLAKEGVRFTRSYVTSSVCTPSRYSCLTGRLASRCDSPKFLSDFPADAQANIAFNTNIVPGSVNLASILQAAGYHTGFVGKWHTGGSGQQPIDADARLDDPSTADKLKANHERLCEYIRGCGFSDVRSVYRGNVADLKLKELDVHNPEWLTQGALDFLEHREAGKPFFLWFCPTLQHSPPPAQSLRGDWRKTPAGLLDQPLKSQPSRESVLQRANDSGLPKPELVASALWLDDSVGAILNRLEAVGELDNTLVLFMSDNGTRAGKGTCYDDGCNTPFLARWPSRIPAETVRHELVANIDLAPTVLDACGVTPPAEFSSDGRSLLPLFHAGDAPWRDALLLEIGHTRAVTDGRWKYIALRYPPELQAKIDAGTLGRKAYHMDVSLNLQENAERGHSRYWDKDQLYDLQGDPREQRNLAGEAAHAERLTEMKHKLAGMLQPLGRKFGDG